MHEEPIGVLLLRRELKQLRKNKNHTDLRSNQYVIKSEELGVDVIFFSINDLSFHNHTVEAFKVVENNFVKENNVKIPSIIYNPTKIFKKKHINKLRKLSQLPGINVINEHHVIKEKSFLELIKSKKELMPYIQNDWNQIETPFTIHILAQKDIKNSWLIPVVYAKDLDEALYKLDEIGPLTKQVEKNLEDKLYRISNLLLNTIHYYYPGIYEIGLLFSINNDGNIYFKSSISVRRIIEDLKGWKPNLYINIVRWPIELANQLSLKSYENVSENKSGNIKKDKQTSLSIIEDQNNEIHEKDFNQTIWVEFIELKDNDKKLILPKNLTKLEENNGIATVHFGIKNIECKFTTIEDSVLLSINSFNNPVGISVSSSLLKELHLRLGMKYQVHFTPYKIIIGPIIGLLLGEKNQMYNPHYMEKYSDRLGVYERFGGVIIAFSPRSIDWENEIVYGMIYNPKLNKWQYGTSPIPSTIYRRNFHQHESRIRKLKELTNNQLFNSYHFKKSDLFLLRDEPIISKHLPETYSLNNIEHLVTFLNNTTKIILKPANLSRGRGIFILEQNEQEEYILSDYRKKYRVRHLIKNKFALKEMLDNLNVLNQNYLFQTYIPLLKVNDRPFDVRVVMQKINRNEWHCSGIECRVAGENVDLTNISRGGFAMSLEDVVRINRLAHSYEAINQNIVTLCQNFCKVMDKTNGHFAEFGIDIALDQEGFPWILEANIFPSFKGFIKMDYETYLKIRYQPLFYAVKLQGFEVREVEEVYG